VVLTRPRTVVQWFLLAAIYVAAAKFGLAMDAVSGFATLVWPPTGIALATLLRGGNRLWPGIALGAFVANLWTGAPLPVALGIAAGNTLEAVVGAGALQRVGGFRPSLERVADVLALALLAAAGSTLVSATLGVASLVVGGVVPWGRAGATWQAWWLGDVIGDLVVAPLLLSWSAAPRPRAGRRVIVEVAAVAAALAGMGFFVFFTGQPIPYERGFPQAYLVFPPLIWAALRFGVRGATVATFGASALAVAGTALGYGPFASASLSGSLTQLQAFMAIVAVTVLMLGVVSAERERAVATREEFLAIVSHDMRNLLLGITVSAAALLRALPVDAREQRRVGEIIRHTATRMHLLVRDLLDLAALQVGKLSVEPKPEDASSVAREAVELAQLLAAEHALTVLGELPEPDLRVYCDRGRVLQVLGNLLGNAVKFTPAGGQVTLRVAAEGPYARFSVIDTGPGLAPDQLPRIFEPFWQAKRVGEDGVGLGLYIARAIVEAHGGTIRAESRRGEGSIFTFTLPVYKLAEIAGP